MLAKSEINREDKVVWLAAHAIDQKRVSIVIVNYNSGAFLNSAIASLESSEIYHETLIVDNDSTDDSQHGLEAFIEGNENYTLIQNPTNLGFACASNIGINTAEGDFILLLNPDCVVEPDSLAELIRVLEENPDAGMVGGLLVNPDGSEQAGGRRAVPTPWRSLVRGFGLSRLAKRYPRLFQDFLLHFEKIPDKPIEVEAISGACMMVRREAIEDVGLLDEEYFMHCEDLDWCMRFRQKKWKVMFTPNARIMHYKGVCSRSRPVFVEWHKHKGMVRFYRKFFKNQYPGLLMWLVVIGVWLRFGLKLVWMTLNRIKRFFSLGS